MHKKYQSRVRKFMVNQSFIFFTGLLSLSIIGNAYGLNTIIQIKNLIPPHHPYYSKNGYKVEAEGKGYCMIGVYSPISQTVRYSKRCFKIGIHYSAAGSCLNHKSTQNFKVTNMDTGNIVGRFTWYKPLGFRPTIKMIENPENFMAFAILITKPNKLNIIPGGY
ncbi:hypothetical protein [Candidatus Sororendozoicomonas aggregata]|uniref:hypothetical protein n=1 Tax=Candidatus Sororendozoicomonas aggregata TaxID=3073239 RepID=UPI002ED629FE